MSWLAHLLGGPLDGFIDVVDGYWPLLPRLSGGTPHDYHLVCCVKAAGSIAPHTPLLYVWSDLEPIEASAAVAAYIAAHRGEGGLLHGHDFTMLIELP